MPHPLVGLPLAGGLRFTPQPGRIALPDVCCCIVVEGGRAWFAGPMTKGHATRHPGRTITLLQVHPLAARAWIGAPLREIADHRVPLDDIRRHATEALLAALDAGAFHEGPGRAAVDRRLALAARLLRNGRSVAEAAAVVGLSPRQLERRFLDGFGMAPKLFASVVRFRRAMLSVGEGRPLAEAAHAHGYADQAHFSRAARAFMGETLRALRPRVAIVQDPPA